MSKFAYDVQILDPFHEDEWAEILHALQKNKYGWGQEILKQYKNSREFKLPLYFTKHILKEMRELLVVSCPKLALKCLVVYDILDVEHSRQNSAPVGLTSWDLRLNEEMQKLCTSENRETYTEGLRQVRLILDNRVEDISKYNLSLQDS